MVARVIAALLLLQKQQQCVSSAIAAVPAPWLVLRGGKSPPPARGRAPLRTSPKKRFQEVEYEDEDDDELPGEVMFDEDDESDDDAAQEEWEDAEGSGEGWEDGDAEGSSDGWEKDADVPYRPRRRPRSRRGPRFDPQAVREKLAGATEELKTRLSSTSHKAKKVLREIKGSLSSDLENTILKATRPDNDPAKRKHVELLLGATEHFPLYMDDESGGAAQPGGPYRTTLRKVWRRMREKDYRTVAKALYLLHRLSRDVTPESRAYFQEAFSALRREPDGKTGSHHFGRKVTRDVSADGVPYASFLDSYATFVFLRMQSCGPGILGLGEAVGVRLSTKRLRRGVTATTTIAAKQTTGTASGSEPVSWDKAEKMVTAALGCSLGGRGDLDNDVTVDCLKLVVEDLTAIWQAYGAALEAGLSSGGSNGVGGASQQALLHMCDFYLENAKPVRDMLAASQKLLAIYSVNPDASPAPKPPADPVLIDFVRERANQLRKTTAAAAVGRSGKGGNGAAQKRTSEL